MTGGKVFITGPYEGAPYGLSIVNPAKAGPFNLGNVVVRAKVEVDPHHGGVDDHDGYVGAVRDPARSSTGSRLQIKHVNVRSTGRTSCSTRRTAGRWRSPRACQAAKGRAAFSVPFQVTNCAMLEFKPKLTVSTPGKTSRTDGASLAVKLTYPAGPDANIARVKVELPEAAARPAADIAESVPGGVSTRTPPNCPAASMIGHAIATTPVLPVPLTGPAYFVSHGGEAFPNLIIVLQGYGATVDLVGSTFISKAGITSSTFKTVPDVPVGTFELTFPQGPYSALDRERRTSARANSRCRPNSSGRTGWCSPEHEDRPDRLRQDREGHAQARRPRIRRGGARRRAGRRRVDARGEGVAV